MTMDHGIATMTTSCCACCSSCKSTRPFQGEAFDLILIQSADDPSLIDCGDVLHSLDMDLPDNVRSGCTLTLEIQQCNTGNPTRPLLKFPIINNKICLPQVNESSTCCPPMERGDDSSEQKSHQHKYSSHDRQALQLLASICLQPGNIPHYVLRSNGSCGINYDKPDNCEYYTAAVNDEEEVDSVVAIASFSIYLWSSADRVVVFDIDGTITRSNIRGFMDTIILETYLYTHLGVCQFAQELSRVEEENETCNSNSNDNIPRIRFVYLSSRPYATASGTRKFLAKMRQQRQYRLPAGPLLGSAKTICQVIYMERVTKDSHVFKGLALLSNIVRPWKAVCCVNNTNTLTTDNGPAGTHTINSSNYNDNDCKNNARDFFLAGFGNQTSDAQAYHEAGMDPSQIYVIDKQSQIRCLDGGGGGIISYSAVALRLTSADDYLRMQGTTFVHGYRDKNLRKHVLRNMKNAPEALLLPIV